MWQKARLICHICFGRKNTLRLKVLISPTFGEQFFAQNYITVAFLYLQFGFVIFWQKNIGAKASRKMFMKLTSGLLFNKNVMSLIFTSGFIAWILFRTTSGYRWGRSTSCWRGQVRLMHSTTGFDFAIILRTAFTLVGPKSAKDTDNLTVFLRSWDLGSISSMLYVQYLLTWIPKAQKDPDDLTEFLHFWDLLV